MKNSTKYGGGAALAVILSATLALEGGYTNDANDSGGETNHGITAAVAHANGHVGDMRELTQEQAKKIYAAQYIVKPGFDKVVGVSAHVGHKVIDYGVNAGPGRAARAYQQALADLSRGGRDYAQPAVDGKVGPATIEAHRKLVAKRGAAKACGLMIKLLDAQQAAHYAGLARTSHSHASFIVGWVDNRVGNVSCKE